MWNQWKQSIEQTSIVFCGTHLHKVRDSKGKLSQEIASVIRPGCAKSTRRVLDSDYGNFSVILNTDSLFRTIASHLARPWQYEYNLLTLQIPPFYHLFSDRRRFLDAISMPDRPSLVDFTASNDNRWLYQLVHTCRLQIGAHDKHTAPNVLGFTWVRLRV